MNVWRFVTDPGLLATSLSGSHEHGLMALSILVAALGGYAALAVLNRVAVAPDSTIRRRWIAIGAVAMGAGTWGMHFTAMLAFRLPGLTLGYGLEWTLASVVPVVAGSAAALSLVAHSPTRSRLGWAALWLAVGIGAMHYMGMEAVQTSARLVYRPALFGLSIVVACVLAVLALNVQIRFGSTGRHFGFRRLGAALLIGLAVSGMHYTAMAAARFLPNVGVETGLHPIAAGWLAMGVATMVVLLTGLVVIGTVVDQRLTDARLEARDGADRHRAMADAMTDGLITVDGTGRVAIANPAFVQLMGGGPGPVVGRQIQTLLRFAPPLADGSSIIEALRERILATHTAEVVRNDGRTVPVDLRLYQLRIADTALVEIIVHDLTEQRRIAEERQRLATAVEQAHDAVVVTRTDLGIVYLNPAFERLAGGSRDELVGTTLDLLEAGEGREGVPWHQVIGGTSWAGEIELCTGAVCTVSASPIRDADGSINHAVTVFRDVTDHRHLEDQLRQAQKLESIGQLAAGIAHEINTPIQFVQDNLRFAGESVESLTRILALHADLRERVDAASPLAPLYEEAARVEAEVDLPYLLREVPQALAEASEGAVRVARIVRAMKDFAHPSTEAAPADINKAVESTVTVATNEWRYLARMTVDLDPSLPAVVCSVGEIGQTVLNLIVNAAHAIGERFPGGDVNQGQIAVRTRAEPDGVVIEVSDNGGGIPDAVAPRIFDPFFTTKGVGKGTGQGLNIAYQAVSRHGGRLTFDTKRGEGTTFRIWLPVNQLQAA